MTCIFFVGNMLRQCKSDPQGRRYKKYDEVVLNAAIYEYQTTTNKPTVSLKTVADKYGINKSVLFRHCIKTMKKQRGETVFSLEAEKYII